MVGYSAKSCMFLLFLPLFPGFAMDSGSCDRNLSDPSGQIYTPGFDEFRSYPSSTTCTWLITVDQSSTIVFQFHTMDIEFDFHCEYDYVLVSRIKEIISSKLNSLHRSSFFFPGISSLDLKRFWWKDLLYTKGIREEICFLAERGYICQGKLSIFDKGTNSTSESILF